MKPRLNDSKRPQQESFIQPCSPCMSGVSSLSFSHGLRLFGLVLGVACPIMMVSGICWMPGIGWPEVMRSTICANEDGYEGSSCVCAWFWVEGLCLDSLLPPHEPGYLVEDDDNRSQSLYSRKSSGSASFSFLDEQDQGTSALQFYRLHRMKQHTLNSKSILPEGLGHLLGGVPFRSQGR